MSNLLRMKPFVVRDSRAAAIVLLAAVYLLAARLGLMMDAVSGFATLVWAPTGLSLAAVVLLGSRVWPGIAAGAFLANVWVGASLPVALGIAAGNTLEALAGAAVLRKVPGFRPSLDRLVDAAALIFLTAVPSAAISATVGVLSLRVAGRVDATHVVETWRAWWVGDVIGDLIVAPLILTLFDRSASTRDPARSRWWRPLEVTSMATLILATGVFVFSGPVSGVLGKLRQPYAAFPELAWVALRFGSPGGALGTFAVSVIAIAGTALGWGPFTHGRLAESLLDLQVFMGFVASTTLILGAVSEERRHALALHDSLFSLASHELKTPLTALQLRIQMLKRTVTGLSEGGQLSTQVGEAERQVKRLTGLVDEMLDVSRIRAGRLRLDIEEIDLAMLVREVVDRIPETQRKLVSLSIPGAAVVGRWDRLRLDEIITNLLSNALKYGEGKPIEIRIEGRPKRARVQVQDHGVGVAPQDRERIFERFERAAAKNVRGIGLGLWIVREVTEALGGNIEVESRLGAGSTFTIDLPLEVPAQAPAGRLAESIKAPSGGGPR